MKQSLSAHYLEIKGISLDKIPKKGPLLIASSHPNSFLDAIIIAVLINRPLHFLARSDVFKAKWADFILRSLNLIPIYRLQEGHQNLSKNDQTFRECNTILDKGGAILIFVEGVSLIDMKLRPLKKGLARIAFGFAEQMEFKKKCFIVPLGLNYDRPTDFRSKITAAVGNIQNVQDYQENYELSKNNTFSILNQILFKEIKEHTVEISEDNYMVYKALAELDSAFVQNSLSRKRLIANKVTEISSQNPRAIKELKDQINEVFSLLKTSKLNFRKIKVNDGLKLIDALFLLFTCPVALVVLIVNFFPLVLAKIITDKKVKLDEFYASVRLVLGTILWIVWTIIITISLLSYSWLFILFPLVNYLAVKFYLHFYEKLKYARAALRLSNMRRRKSDYEKIQQLIKQIYKIKTKLGLSVKA